MTTPLRRIWRATWLVFQKTLLKDVSNSCWSAGISAKLQKENILKRIKCLYLQPIKIIFHWTRLGNYWSHLVFTATFHICRPSSGAWGHTPYRLNFCRHHIISSVVFFVRIIPFFPPLYMNIYVQMMCITLKFLSPTNAPLYYTYKMLKRTVKISHVCSYMFRSIWTIYREPMPNLAKVTILCN